MQPRHPLEIELDAFPGRAEALRRVMRYQMYEIMYYRTNLLSHSRRLSWHVRARVDDFEKILGGQFDSQRAIAIALVHDDHEIVLGDVQLTSKNAMNHQQLTDLDRAERRAIHQTASRFPSRLGPYPYEDLLLEKLDLVTPEAQVVTYLDKFEGLSEALHELFAGNRCFATPHTNHRGTHPIPPDVYAPVIAEFGQKYPATQPLFAAKLMPFRLPEPLDVPATIRAGRPHTDTSLAQPSGYPAYDYWREVMRTYADSEELSQLTHQREPIATAE